MAFPIGAIRGVQIVVTETVFLPKKRDQTAQQRVAGIHSKKFNQPNMVMNTVIQIVP